MDPTTRADAVTVSEHRRPHQRHRAHARRRPLLHDVIKQIRPRSRRIAGERGRLTTLRTCVTAIQDADTNERERVLAEITEVFRHTNKP